MSQGGLTQALREGSLVVNSSQGGSSKDAQVVEQSTDMLSRVTRKPLLARSLLRARRKYRPARS